MRWCVEGRGSDGGRGAAGGEGDRIGRDAFFGEVPVVATGKRWLFVPFGAGRRPWRWCPISVEMGQLRAAPVSK